MPKKDPKENPNEVIFSAPVKGMGDSPYLGAADVRQLNIMDIPGIATPLIELAKVTATTIGAGEICKWAVVDNNAAQTAYVLTGLANGNASNKIYTADAPYTSWALLTHASPSTGHGNGLAIWKGYLVLAGDTLLDFMLISSGVWTDGWGDFAPGSADLQSDTIGHPMFKSLDDKLYIGNSQYVNSIAEATAPFAPGTSASYTAVDKAITLPAGSRVRCLEELGSNLMIGIFVGNTLTKMAKVAKIYPWSRTGTILGLPISLNEAGIHQMIVVNNELFFQAGIAGNYYKTNGSTSQFLCRIPPNLRNPYRLTISHPGAIINYKGRILSGITVGLISQSGVTASAVYSFNTDGSQFIMEKVISTGVSDSGVTIGCLLSLLTFNVADDYIIGWYDATTGAQGIDLPTGSQISSYLAYFDSEIKNVGTALQNRTFTKLEVYLEQKMSASPNGIKVAYRTDTLNSFTVLGTYDNNTDPTYNNFNKSINITKAAQLQVRVSLSGITRFKYIRFYG